MKVAQIHTSYREPGGEDTVVDSEARLLGSAGHLVVQHRAANPAGAASAAGLVLSPWNPAAGRRAAAFLAAERPDVAHVHNTWFAMSPSVPAAARRAGVPVVTTLHNYRRVCANASLFRDGAPCLDCVATGPSSGVRHRCYRSSLPASAAVATTIALNRRASLSDRSVDLFVVLNAFMRDVLARGGLPLDRTVVKGNTVPDPGPRTSAPGLSGTVLVVGRVEPLKGVSLLVDAWARARPEGLELVVVGDGPQREELEARRVPGTRFLGRCDRAEVVRLMTSARALALPSLWFEGQPMTVLEAMAAGLPVLASDTGGNPDLLADLGPGWLVERGSQQAWERALVQLAERPADEVDAAGAAARERWRRDHSEGAGLLALEAAYARVGA